ncbi:MAG TPA: flagellar biosynthesis anti-sigma factor FlgM [Bryobacteraceae bacterium]|nr:flagellar biosynthesis anti-sigma factor FlgM [Bryobacteraceae bacterium]
MKIDNSRGVTPPESGNVRKSPAREEKPVGRPEDRVELSHQSRTAAQDLSRAACIEQLRAQVENGNYHVPAEDIAHSIVDEMLGDKSG